MASHLDNYEFVEDRLKRWWAAYPNAQIVTTMVHYDGKTVVFRTEGIVEGRVIATGYAEEVHGSSPVNKTSFVENCETSSVGRMIGNSPLGTKPGARPSRQEMQKVERLAESSQRSPIKALLTQPQMERIKRDASKRGMSEEQLFDHVMEKYGVILEMLDRTQASELIDSWK